MTFVVQRFWAIGQQIGFKDSLFWAGALLF